MATALALLALALVLVAGCLAVEIHEKALAWRRHVATAIDIANYRKGPRR